MSISMLIAKLAIFESKVPILGYDATAIASLA